ncbi:ribonuclease P [Malassezia yamatoensis]|uniref:Ribonuclease P n=1 Tax=Malassezia yamatoensis TaxID=253288 RepID=A0AAJ5YSI6_9BASI|nr:ribonuclease P [Malassezia yamatoensis]
MNLNGASEPTSQDAIQCKAKMEMQTFLPHAPEVTAYAITKALRASLLSNFGDAAAGAYSGPLLCKYYSSKSGVAVVRCAREGVRYVWASATLLQHIEQHPTRISVCACSGTIRKIQHKAIAIDRHYVILLEKSKLNSKSKSAQQLSVQEEIFPMLPDDDLGVALDEDEEDDTQEPVTSVPCKTFENTTQLYKRNAILSSTAQLLERNRKKITDMS